MEIEPLKRGLGENEAMRVVWSNVTNVLVRGRHSTHTDRPYEGRKNTTIHT